MSIASELSKLVNVFREWPHPEPEESNPVVIYNVTGTLNALTYEITNTSIERNISNDELAELTASGKNIQFCVKFDLTPEPASISAVKSSLIHTHCYNFEASTATDVDQRFSYHSEVLTFTEKIVFLTIEFTLTFHDVDNDVLTELVIDDFTAKSVET